MEWKEEGEAKVKWTKEERVRRRKPMEIERRQQSGRKMSHGGGGDKSNLRRSRTNLRLN